MEPTAASIHSVEEVPSEPLRFSAGVTKRLVGPHNGAKNIDLHLVILDPADRAGPLHLHPRAESAYLVLHGGVRFRINGEDHDVGPEQFVFIPAGVPHSVINPRTTPARLLGIYAPPGDDFVHLEGPDPEEAG
jgi:mannose-6-phosphate isomerase-like protein (cupin superfamily)